MLKPRVLLLAVPLLVLAGCSSAAVDALPGPAASTPSAPTPAPTVTVTVATPVPDDPAAALTNLDAYSICRIVGSQSMSVATSPGETWAPYSEAHFDALEEGRIGVYSEFQVATNPPDTPSAAYCVLHGTRGEPVVDFTTVMADLDPKIGPVRYKIYLSGADR